MNKEELTYSQKGEASTITGFEVAHYRTAGENNGVMNKEEETYSPMCLPVAS